MPKAKMMIDAMIPRPGAAKVVVPKYGIGMALLTDGVPGIADIVNVNAPRPMVAGIKPARDVRSLKHLFRHRDQHEKGNEDADAAIGDRRPKPARLRVSCGVFPTVQSENARSR